ncbi:MAG: putative pyoverdin transport system ATP-binding/permease protein [Verrucomicrobiota bacterium]
MELLRFLRRATKEMSFGRVLVVAAAVVGIAAGFVGSTLIGVLNAALSPTAERARAWPALFFGFCLLIPITRFLSEGLLVSLSQRALADLRMSLSKSLLQIEVSQIEQLGQDRLFTILTTDVDRLAQVLAVLPLVIMNLAMVAGCCVYLAALSLKLLGVVAGLVLGALLVYLGGASAVMKDQSLARRQWDKVVTSTRALIYGAKELKLNRSRRDHFLAETVQSGVLQLKDYASKAGIILSLLRVWVQFAFFAITGLAAFAFGPMFGLSPTASMAFVLTFVYAAIPVEALLGLMPALSQGVISLRRLQDTGLQVAQPIAEPKHAPRVREFKTVTFQNLSFAYPARSGAETPFKVGPVDLQLERGSLVFVTGANGAGKTTLLKLIAGLYPSLGGWIGLDGSAIGLECYREQVSAVFTDAFVFSDVAGTRLPLNGTEAERWIDLLDAQSLVSTERPWQQRQDLSHGQRMRVALLSALLEDRPIVLLDEWAAHQQPGMREQYYRKLLPELRRQGKAVVAVSHDEAFFDEADRLIMLSDGCVSPWERSQSYAKTAIR